MLNSTIVTVIDDFGPLQGPVPNGGATDDTTPTFKISFSSDVVAGDHVLLSAAETNTVYSQTVTADDVARGYVLFTLPAQQDGHHDFRAFVNDPADNAGPASPDYSFDIQPDSTSRNLQGQPGGSNLIGGSGDDTLTGGAGPDTMTGNAGADHFVWNSLPWQAATITDFTHGTDKIDVSALLSASHYTGSDPIGDGYVKLLDDGHGDTWLYYDTDGHGTADQWGTFIATLQHVSPAQVTDADLITGSATSPPPTSPPPTSPPPVSPPPASGMTLQGQPGGSNLQGGSGDDTLIGGSGPDTMTGAAGADHFVWNSLPWQGGEVTDFTEGADKIDLSHLLASVGYSGTDPIADGYVKLLDDGHGDTWLYFDTDGHGAADQWGTFVATLQHVSASGLTSSDFIFH